MDTLEDIDNLKPYSVKRTDTKALLDDEPEDTFFRLLDALSVKATSWFSFQDNRPQLDGSALCCLGLLVEEFIRYQQTPLIDIMHKNLNIPSLKQLLTPEEFQSGSLPVLIQKYKKKHQLIEEGHVKQRPRLLEDLRESYLMPSRLQQYQEQVSNHVDEQLKKEKKKEKGKEREKQKKNKKNTALKDTHNQEEKEEEEEEKSNSVDFKVESITESQYESESSPSSPSSILPTSSSQPSQVTNKPHKHEKKMIKKKRKASESDLFDTINNKSTMKKKKSKVIDKSKSNSKAKPKSKPTLKPKSKKPSFF